MAIRILTDSTADLTQADAARANVRLVYMNILFGDTVYQAGKDLTSARFYQLLQQEPVNPTTSQPSPESFLKEFEEAKEAGDQVVCVLLSSVLSGTVQSAQIARHLSGYEDSIFIVDSLTATAGTRVMVDYACSLRDQGLSAGEIADEVNAIQPRVHVMGVIDTLEYLYRGGRLTRLQASIGTVAKLKPIVGTRDGAVVVMGKAFGLAAGVKQMLKIVDAAPIDENFSTYYLYTDDITRTEMVLSKMEESGLDTSRMVPCSIGPTVGTHIGPGGLGIAYVEKA